MVVVTSWYRILIERMSTVGLPHIVCSPEFCPDDMEGLDLSLYRGICPKKEADDYAESLQSSKKHKAL